MITAVNESRTLVDRIERVRENARRRAARTERWMR
jgi:hypothetical protein